MKRIIFLFLAVAIFASCGEKTTTAKKTEELTKLKKDRSDLDQKIAKLELEVNKNSPIKATPVSVTTVQTESFNSYIELQAQVTGDENVLATPQMMGVVKNIMVHVGQKVGKGQTLATLDSGPIEQQITAQAAQLNLLKELYSKQQKLWAQNIGTQVQLLQAKAQYESALSQKQALIAQRNMYTIKSPISGVVDEVGVKIGDAAAPGAAGIRVVSKDKLKATANLGENYLGKVHQGDVVILEFPDMKETVRTRLSYVSQTVNPVSRTFNAEVKLSSTSWLHPNMSCRMKIANYANSNAITVPVSIIQKTSTGDLLYVADGNKARAVNVEVGKISNGNAEILSGLSAGDKIITVGYEDLNDGEAISIQ